MKTLLLSLLLSSAQAADPTLDQLLNASDDVFRGAKSRAVIEMQVKTDRYERSMKMEAWSEGTESSLIRIVEPAKEAGVTTLKVGDNIWNYLPKVDRTMKIPAGMMGGSWMGSHFSNDDLVKESRMSEDFDGKIIGRPESGGEWVIELIPKPTAAVVWGKVVARINADLLPTRIEYYDEKGALARTMLFEEVGLLGGRTVPKSMVLMPADKPDEYTRVRYLELDFDSPIPEGTFTLQALKR